MADLKSSDSAYDTGSASTHTDLVNNVDTADADHVNHVASGVLAIEAILGTGTTLKGTAADLATRLDIPLETSGKLKDFSATNKTTFPISVAEGGTNAATFSASEIIRRNASTQTLESTGYTVPGSSGVMVSEGDTQTLTAKTLTTPTIGDYTNGQHDHTNAAGGGVLTQSAIGANTIGTSQIKFGTGSANPSSNSALAFAVNQYAFASPENNPNGTSTGVNETEIAYGAADGTTYRSWQHTNNPNNTDVTITWDYITSSENPSIWASVVPITGEILTIWESEDPVNALFPSDPPITGPNVIEITGMFLDKTFLDKLVTLLPTKMPKWKDRSIFKDEVDPEIAGIKLQKYWLENRGAFKKDESPITPVPDDWMTDNSLTDQRKIWRTQLWLRSKSMMEEDHQNFTLIYYLKNRFKIIGSKLMVK